MSLGSGLPTAVLLTTGQVLIAGGYNDGEGYLSSTEIYDPAGNTFTSGPPMNAARANATYSSVLLNNGDVLIAGGFNGGAGLASTELYVAATTTFVVGPPMSTGRANTTATLLHDGDVLIAGGFSGCCHNTAVASTDLYQTANNTFVPGPDMNAARQAHTATLLDNGDVLIAGGTNGTGGGTNGIALASTDLYQSSTNTFVAGPKMNSAREGAAATLLH